MYIYIHKDNQLRTASLQHRHAIEDPNLIDDSGDVFHDEVHSADLEEEYLAHMFGGLDSP